MPDRPRDVLRRARTAVSRRIEAEIRREPAAIIRR
jgi:hypothetical protein